MCDYVGNTVTLEGPLDILNQIIETKFDFNVLHPIPENVKSPSDWVGRHWTVSRNRDPDSFVVEKFSEEKKHLTVWFRTKYSCPFALFAFITKKYPELKLDVVYSAGYSIDYIGIGHYEGGKVIDTRIYPDKETPKALATFSQKNPDLFNYQEWKELQKNLGINTFKDVDDTPDENEQMKHISILKGTYDTIVCEYDEHNGDWQDKCEVCIDSNNPLNYSK